MTMKLNTTYKTARYGGCTYALILDKRHPKKEKDTFPVAMRYTIDRKSWYSYVAGEFTEEDFDRICTLSAKAVRSELYDKKVEFDQLFEEQIAMIEAGMIPPVVKVGNLKSLRTYADVRDAVRAYYMLVTCDPIGGEYYNIGGSYTREVGDTLNTLISYSPMKDQIKVETDPERLRPIDADLQVPDCRKFKAHTGWEPEISFEKTMHDLLDYWRQRVNKGEQFLTR